MNNTLPYDPGLDAMLSELAALGMRAARAVVRVMEIEQAAAEVAGGWLDEARGQPGSLSEAAVAGQAADAVNAALAQAVPRVEVLARALDRVARSVRRSVALLRRMQAGWPRGMAADDRATMVRRQVARGVGEAIVRECDGEAAERLFDELAERLDERLGEASVDGVGLVAGSGSASVEEIVRLVCRDLGLAAAALEGEAAGVSLGARAGGSRTKTGSASVGPGVVPDANGCPVDTC